MLTFPPDFTFVVQLGTYFVLLLILARLVFTPFLELLDERAARTAGDVATAAEQRSEVETLSASIDADLAKAKAAALSEVEAARRASREEARELLEHARSEASERLAELRSELAASAATARTGLASEASALAEQMVAAVLGSGARP